MDEHFSCAVRLEDALGARQAGCEVIMPSRKRRGQVNHKFVAYSICTGTTSAGTEAAPCRPPSPSRDCVDRACAGTSNAMHSDTFATRYRQEQ